MFCDLQIFKHLKFILGWAVEVGSCCKKVKSIPSSCSVKPEKVFTSLFSLPTMVHKEGKMRRVGSQPYELMFGFFR